MSGRQDVLDRLDEVIDFAAHKSLGSGRIRDDTRAKTRIKYLQCIVSAANAKRGLLKDRDLEDLAERIDRLENQRSGSDYRVK